MERCIEKIEVDSANLKMDIVKDMSLSSEYVKELAEEGILSGGGYDFLCLVSEPLFICAKNSER